MTESPTKMLVINEWLFHDLQGENGREKQIETSCSFRHLNIGGSG